MKKVLSLLLGFLTAIGGFVDIGDLVVEAEVGSRFGLSLVWVVIVGVVGVCLFVQMSGRVAAVSKRATFQIIRERLGPRMGLANLGASFFINLLTLAAEVGDIALSLQLDVLVSAVGISTGPLGLGQLCRAPVAYFPFLYGPVVQGRDRCLTIPAGPANLLVVRVERLCDGRVYDEPHIRLVNTYPERGGRHHDVGSSARNA